MIIRAGMIPVPNNSNLLQCSCCGGSMDVGKQPVCCTWCGSWLTDIPKEESMAMDIGGAVNALRDGKRVTRGAWHHTGRFVYYVPAARYAARTDAGKSIADGDGMVAYDAYLAEKTNYGAVGMWNPTADDLLGSDWYIV